MNMNGKRDGVSPILAILLLIAITLMLAGIVSLWAFSFVNDETEANKLYTFEVTLESSSDNLSMTMISGKIISTIYFKVIMDNNELTIPEITLKAGEPLIISTGIDIVLYQTYNIKIVVKEKVIYDQDIIAV